MNAWNSQPKAQTPRHKVFVNYYHNDDQAFRERFEYLFTNVFNIMVSKSVQIGDIDVNLKTETIRQKIRDEYLRDSTVTVVLIGRNSWQRKHIDWEISSSIRSTQYSPRSGLLGILLPTHPDYKTPFFSQQKSISPRNPSIIPQRLFMNYECKYAFIYNWSEKPEIVASWIHAAYLRRTENINPNNKLPLFGKNHSGQGWKY